MQWTFLFTLILPVLGVAGAGYTSGKKPAQGRLAVAIGIAIGRDGDPIKMKDAEDTAVQTQRLVRMAGKKPGRGRTQRHQRSFDNLRIYVPGSRTCNSTAMAALQYVPSASKFSREEITSTSALKDVLSWLWCHNEYVFTDYVAQRLLCTATVVAHPDDADVCFPSCNVREGGGDSSQQLTQLQPPDLSQEMRPYSFVLEIPHNEIMSWNGCKTIHFGPEVHLENPCAMVVPYMHGISWPISPHDNSNSTLPPWFINWNINSRSYLLTYVGGLWRGHNRSSTYYEMVQQAKLISPTNPQSVVKAPFAWANHSVELHGHSLYLSAWEAYAEAMFAWMPHGDYPTRGAFFQSLMLGCIPVIESAAARYYSKLFNGTLFSKTNFGLQDVALIIPEGAEQDGSQILNLVTSVLQTEYSQRRDRIALIAEYLQWGWGGPHDAFKTALDAFGLGAVGG